MDNTEYPIQVVHQGPVANPWSQLPKTTIVYQTSGQTIGTGAGGAAALSFDAAIDDVGAWDISDPTHITIPAGAVGMRVMGHVEWATNATGLRSIRMRINDLAVNVGSGDPYYSITDTREAHATISCHQGTTGLYMQCVPGDQISMVVRQDSGGDLLTSVGATYIAVEWYF